tara:strand:- start:409 stop:615 length:207 start_codon:yes stop_codon:yes gene_type:complete
MKKGDLVKYIPNPSTLFKWQTYLREHSRKFGVVMDFIEDVPEGAVLIQWSNGKSTIEKIRLLKIISES